MSVVYKNPQVQEIHDILEIEYMPCFNAGELVCFKDYPDICIGSISPDINYFVIDNRVPVFVSDDYIKNFTNGSCTNTTYFDVDRLQIYKPQKTKKEPQTVMETQTMELVVPEGFEFDNNTLKIEDGKLVITAVKTKPLYSKTWEEFCEYNNINKDEAFITANGSIQTYPSSSKPRQRDVKQNKTNMPHKFAYAFLALEQLLTIRELEYTKGWEPTANPKEYFWAIWAGTDCTINTGERCGVVYPLSFPSKELCMEFYNNWQNLIMTAGLLL